MPLALIGGAIRLPGLYYRPIVGVVLLIGAVRLLWPTELGTNKEPRDPPIWAGVLGGAAQASALFEQPDHDQENHRPDNGVDDRRDDPANENKPDQRQEPTGQDGADDADYDVTNESKTVSFDD
jgi:hypothetical protein